jgi:signal transduction histidine kinase
LGVIQIIYNSSMLMKLLNSAMLNLALIKQGKYEFSKSLVTDLSPVVRNFATLFEEHIKAKKIHFNLVHELRGSQNAIDSFQQRGVMVDLKLYEQIFYNIFVNACKFNKQRGSISCELAVHEELTSFREQAILITTTVRDTGKGMTRKQIQMLCKLFETVKNQDEDQILSGGFKKKNQGFGLGLHLSE